MKLFKFYDYIFFRLSSFYAKQHGNENRFGSMVLLSFTQSSNFILIGSLILIILNKSIKIPYLIIVLLSITFFYIFNTIRYKYFVSFQDLYERWKNENVSERLKKGIYIMLFLFLSLLLSPIIAHFGVVN